MCPNHPGAFNSLRFFIRSEFHLSLPLSYLLIETRRRQYIFVRNDSCDMTDHLREFHGKAIALDIKDITRALPLLFLVHEYRVRGENFLPTNVRRGGNQWLAGVGGERRRDKIRKMTDRSRLIARLQLRVLM